MHVKTKKSTDDLCDVCLNSWPNCPGLNRTEEELKFGDGRGKDNVVECPDFTPRVETEHVFSGEECLVENGYALVVGLDVATIQSAKEFAQRRRPAHYADVCVSLDVCGKRQEREMSFAEFFGKLGMEMPELLEGAKDGEAIQDLH